jgi:antitoxin CptB
MDAREELNRAKWASRRGLLELDLLLSPFVTSAFDSLTDELKNDYRALLFNDDQDLMEWIMGRSELPDPRFDGIIAAIQAFHAIG